MVAFTDMMSRQDAFIGQNPFDHAIATEIICSSRNKPLHRCNKMTARQKTKPKKMLTIEDAIRQKAVHNLPVQSADELRLCLESINSTFLST